MKSKFPNTSILNIITQSKSNKETIVFFHIKNVPDYTENGIFWFENKGRNGKATFIWEKLLLKQWLVIGKDDNILKLLEEILEKQTVTINSKTVNFNIPKYNLVVSDKKIITSRIEISYDSYIIDDLSVIPREFLNKDNLNILSGLKKDDTIKPLFPIGIYEKDFIFNHINKKIFGIVEHRQPFLTFRGVRKNSIKEKGSKQIIGFCQDNFVENNKYFVTVKNDKNIEIRKNEININDGTFKIDLSEPVIRGSVVVSKKINDNSNEITVKEIEFTLIQDISIDINVTNKTFKDIYGREFMISQKKKKTSQNLKPIYWEKSLFNKEIEAYKKLSDIFRQVFEYLGENILIADPYFIGLIKLNETTNEYQLSNCQKSLINAITHYSLECVVESITILGNSRAKNISDKIENNNSTRLERRFENYDKFFQNYISQNKLNEYFPKIIFRNSTKSFHNRYWFSISERNGIKKIEKCLIVTNSFGNIEEIDIVPCSDEEQFNLIASKFLRYLNNSTIEAEI